MSEVCVVSDLHIGHRNICKYRPEFSSPEEHNDTLIDNVLGTCGKRDTLWLLGDICFSEEYDWIYRRFCADIGQVNLVLGNHDTENKERQRILRTAIEAGVRVHSLVSYKGCLLSHAPVHQQELRGKYNIHGHMHRRVLDDPRYYNVCVEHTDWRPVAMRDVISKLKERCGEY